MLARPNHEKTSHIFIKGKTKIKASNSLSLQQKSRMAMRVFVVLIVLTRPSFEENADEVCLIPKSATLNLLLD